MNAYSDALKKRKMSKAMTAFEGKGGMDEEAKEDEMHDLAPTVKDGLPGAMEAGDADQMHPNGTAHDQMRAPDSDGPSLSILFGHAPSEMEMGSLMENRKPKSLLERAQMALAKKVNK